MNTITFTESEIAYLIHGLVPYYFTDIEIRKRIRMLCKAFPSLESELPHEQGGISTIPENKALEKNKA